jgi:WS/DGAT/MGAT family acyltransferase
MKSLRRQRATRAVARGRHRRHAGSRAIARSQPRAAPAAPAQISLVRQRVPEAAPAQAPPAYEWLSAEDRMFLRFEGPNVQMHVGALLLFAGGGLVDASGRADLRRIRQHVAANLHAIPRYRQRLHPAPGDGAPVWVDDASFELAAHVRHVRLASPGDEDALHRLASRLLSQRLDRSRPLWEMWVVDGLADGRFAIVSKAHHCMVDGIGGADLLAMLLSPMEGGAIQRAPHWVPRPAPSASLLVRDRIARQAHAGRTAAGELWRIVRRPSVLDEWRRSAAGFWKAFGLGVRPAPDSPINRPIGPHRRFAWFAVELGEVKRIKNQLGGTVNDVVLATVAGALRQFLLRRDPDERPSDLRALVPVSTRAAESSGLGNHVAAWLLPLPVSEALPHERHERVRATTAALRGAYGGIGAEMMTGAGSSLMGLGVRLVERLRPFNIVVTNVPGPPIPLYLLDAELENVYPLVPLFPNQGLGVAVFSYAGTLGWGFNADCHVVPDVDELVDATSSAFHELAAAADAAARRSVEGTAASAP